MHIDYWVSLTKVVQSNINIDNVIYQFTGISIMITLIWLLYIYVDVDLVRDDCD